jgi:hypothetical protein
MRPLLHNGVVNVSAATNQQATIEELLEAVFSKRSVPSLYNEDTEYPHHWKFSKVHTAFGLPYVYDYITKLCMQQAEVIQSRENEHVRSIGQGEARHKI